MKYFFDQHYQCGTKKFYNIFQAFNEQQRTNHFPEYIIDKELVENIKNFKRPQNLSVQYIRSIMVNRLKQIRKSTRKLKLLYTGGTDSFTILKLCVDNDIFVDEIATHMASITQDTRTNIEYLPGLKYAKKHVKQSIGKINIINPTIKDMSDKLQNADWFLDHRWLAGAHLHRRSYSLPIIINENLNLDDDTIVLTGFEKPRFLVQENKVYWTHDDSGLAEMSGIPNTIPFFLDKNNPELVGSMSFAFLDSFDRSQFTSDHYLHFNGVKNKGLKQNIIKNMGLYSTGKHYIDFHMLGKALHDQNSKTKRFVKELLRSESPELFDKLSSVDDRIYSRYKNLPHAVEKVGDFVKSVGRYCQKIPILQDKFAG